MIWLLLRDWNLARCHCELLQIVHLLYTVAMIRNHGNSWPEPIRADRSRSPHLLYLKESIYLAHHSIGNVVTESFFVQIFLLLLLLLWFFCSFCVVVLRQQHLQIPNQMANELISWINLDFYTIRSFFSIPLWVWLWLSDTKQKKSHTLKFRLRVHVKRRRKKTQLSSFVQRLHCSEHRFSFAFLPTIIANGLCVDFQM